MSYRYILRYFIDPFFDPDERIDELARFCLESKVEEVMLFVTPEELSAGHPTEEELSGYIQLAKRVKNRLAPQGVDLSLNPWTTLYMVPRGRRLRPGQNFRLMKGETGLESPVVACPLCDEWLGSLCEKFARLAREVEPTAIWIEDDWRLHNHGGDLGWGGCFCDVHMRAFSEEIGREVDRRELLENVLQAGTPHPWRKVWMALSRKSLLEPLKKLCHAIRTARRETRVGLMTSMPDQHSIEGRDWASLHKVAGDERGLLLRPHMLPYTQERPMRVTPAITLQTLACFSDPVDVYPELENSPRCGIFSKSPAYTVWQMLETAIIGSPGITINHFDMMGNGIALDRSIGAKLAAAKPVLNAIFRLGPGDFKDGQVQVLFSPDIAPSMELEPRDPLEACGSKRLSLGFQDPSQAGKGDAAAGPSFQELAHSSVVWGEVCSILGIAHRMTTRIEEQNGPVFVGGQTLRAFSDDEIGRLLGGPVLLDAESALVLIQRGWKREIGLEGAVWKTLSESGFSYEAILEVGRECYDVAMPRMSAQRCSERMLDMKVVGEARILTQVHDGARKPLWPGAFFYRNERGGDIVVFAYPMDGKAQFFMGFFNVFRQKFFQRTIYGLLNTRNVVMVEGGLRCYLKKSTGGILLSALNPTDEVFERIRFSVSSQHSFTAFWKVLTEEGEWSECVPCVEKCSDHVVLDFPGPLLPLKARVFVNVQG